MPNYPMDLPARVEVLEQMLPRVLAAAQTRPALNQISGGRLQIGIDGGPRIVIGIGDDGLPEFLFYPSAGDTYARIFSGGDFGATGIGMVGQSDASGNQFQTIHKKDLYQVLHMSDDADQADGGMLQLGAAFAASGYFGTAEQYANYWYHQFDRSTLVGRFKDLGAGTYWGIVCGGKTVSSGSGGGIITYGPTMASTMNPVACVRDGAGTPNFYWCVTASSSSGFTLLWSNTSGKEIDFWCFRT